MPPPRAPARAPTRSAAAAASRAERSAADAAVGSVGIRRPQLGRDAVRPGGHRLRPRRRAVGGRGRRCRGVGRPPAGSPAAARSQVPAEQEPVLRTPRHQVLVRADIDHPAVDDHRDLIGQRQRRSPVGDQDRRPVRGHPAQGGVDRRLGDRVDGAGRVIQHQHPRVGDQCPGQGQALPLPTGQGQAPLADHRVVPVGQRLDEVGRLRAHRRRPDLGVGGVRAAVADVRGDGVGEQERLLEHHADRAAQVLHRQVTDVQPADPHDAALRVVEAGQQQRHGRFPGPGCADQRHRRTGGHLQVERRAAPGPPANSRSARRRTPRPTSRRARGNGSRPLGDLRQRVDDLQHPLHRCPGLLAEYQQHGQHPGRRDQLGQVQREGQERAQRNRADQRQVSAEGQHPDLTQGRQRLQRGADLRGQPDRSHPVRVQPPGAVAQPSQLAVLLAEPLHHPDPGDVLLDDLRHLGRGLLRRPGRREQHRPGCPGHQHHRRHHQQRHHREQRRQRQT